MGNFSNNVRHVGFEVLTAVSTKMDVFWVVTPCCLVEVYRRFRGPCCLHHQGLMMEANFYPTTRRYNPEDSHLNVRYNEMLGIRQRIANSRIWRGDCVPLELKGDFEAFVFLLLLLIMKTLTVILIDIEIV
jgi:hypothetical protein